MIVVNNYFEVSSLFPQINHGENKLLLIDDDNDHRGTFESVGGGGGLSVLKAAPTCRST